VLGGLSLIRRGPPVRILAGEIGGIRLTEALVLSSPDRCVAVKAHRELLVMQALTKLVTRSDIGTRSVLDDPLTVQLLGKDAEIDIAFRAAGWFPAQKRSVLSVTR